MYDSELRFPGVAVADDSHLQQRSEPLEAIGDIEVSKSPSLNNPVQVTAQPIVLASSSSKSTAKCCVIL
jgi:hypothetical protein